MPYRRSLRTLGAGLATAGIYNVARGLGRTIGGRLGGFRLRGRKSRRRAPPSAHVGTTPLNRMVAAGREMHTLTNTYNRAPASWGADWATPQVLELTLVGQGLDVQDRSGLSILAHSIVFKGMMGAVTSTTSTPGVCRILVLRYDEDASPAVQDILEPNTDGGATYQWLAPWRSVHRRDGEAVPLWDQSIAFPAFGALQAPIALNKTIALGHRMDFKTSAAASARRGRIFIFTAWSGAAAIGPTLNFQIEFNFKDL